MHSKTETPEWLELPKDDLLFLGETGGFETAFIDEEETSGKVPSENLVPPVPNTGEILKALSTVIITDGPQAFCEFVAAHKEEVYRAAMFDEDVVRALLVGYKMGIHQKCGACANDLGAMYYMGDLVEQDYHKAAELYELATEWGCSQSIINMGYIYEYGRIGEPDYAKAYECYSLAAALTRKSEALYKLGDMYSRGRSVEKSLSRAAQLWSSSLQEADGPQELAQPSIRLAPFYLEGSEEARIEKDPMFALRLYQTAEIGLRMDIGEGLTYYRKRLEQAIEGQEKARLQLDEVTYL